MDLRALKTEITSDPVGIGYAGKPDAEVAALLNEPLRPNLNRESLTPSEFVQAIDPAEFFALTQAQRDWIALVASTEDIFPIGNVRAGLITVFPAGTSTRAALLALLRETGSRARELGFGRVTPSQVADARRLP